MKYLFVLLLIFSCNERSYKSESDILSEMKSPVRIIAISFEEHGLNSHHVLTVIDSSGRIETFYEGMALAFCKSRKVNDTIK